MVSDRVDRDECDCADERPATSVLVFGYSLRGERQLRARRISAASAGDIRLRVQILNPRPLALLDIAVCRPWRSRPSRSLNTHLLPFSAPALVTDTCTGGRGNAPDKGIGPRYRASERPQSPVTDTRIGGRGNAPDKGTGPRLPTIRPVHKTIVLLGRAVARPTPP